MKHDEYAKNWVIIFEEKRRRNGVPKKNTTPHNFSKKKFHGGVNVAFLIFVALSRTRNKKKKFACLRPARFSYLTFFALDRTGSRVTV
jgi:hypothetical protein